MKGTRIRLYLLGLFATSLLWGCTAATVEDLGAEDARLVTLSFGHPDLGVPTAKTRAGVPESLPTGATVRVAAYYRKATDGLVDFATTAPSYQATYQVTADGTLSPCTVDDNGEKTADAGPALSVRAGLYDFYAVSPARKQQSPDPAGGHNNYHITDIPQKEDVMTSSKRGFTVSAGSNTVSLATFDRKCALVVFNVEPDTGNKVDFVSLKGTRLKLKGISTAPASLAAGETNHIDATRGTVDNPNAQLEFIDTEFENATSPGSSFVLNKTKGAILPKLAGQFDVEIDVERDGQSAHLTATIDPSGQTALERGKRYIFTLRIKNNKGSLYLRVLDWNTYTVTDGGVGTPGPVPPTDPDIIPGVGIPMQVAEWNNIEWTGNGSAGGSCFLTIDQQVADAYKRKCPDLLNEPPFNYDHGVASGTAGSDYKGNSATCRVTAPYLLEVESTQSQIKYKYDTNAAIRYCQNKGSGWRVPMIIELFAMWDKCKGNDPNGNATDDEEESTAFGEKFISFGGYYYWSSSVGVTVKNRTILYFGDGRFSGYGTVNFAPGYHVRCVRDLN